jgi:DNA-directed RNA polymerase specialized sigma24 family protein
MDKRETVIKLAHLGWSPAEIASTTKLSRGEVELILELAPKR